MAAFRRFFLVKSSKRVVNPQYKIDVLLPHYNQITGWYPTQMGCYNTNRLSPIRVSLPIQLQKLGLFNIHLH